jgi:hypothetical protein
MIENHQHITKDTRRKERRREEDHLLDDLDEMSSAFPTAIRDVSNIACERIQQSGKKGVGVHVSRGTWQVGGELTQQMMSAV